MRVVVQRCHEAEVKVKGTTVGRIERGLLVLLGIETNDDREDAEWLASKLLKMRLFNDAEGLMNCSLQEVVGGMLVVSQFTLHAKTKKGNRPSFVRAAPPEIAEPLYAYFLELLRPALGERLQTGQFGTLMQVSLTNNGPVTIVMDSKARE